MSPARLVLLRDAHELSQRALAEHLGLTPGYISLLEAGERQPSAGVLQKLATYFRVEVEVLFLPPRPGCTRQAS